MTQEQITKYVRQTRECLTQGYTGWDVEDQTVIDELKAGTMLPTCEAARALLSWCENNSANARDGAAIPIIENLKKMGVVPMWEVENYPW